MTLEAEIRFLTFVPNDQIMQRERAKEDSQSTSTMLQFHQEDAIRLRGLESHDELLTDVRRNLRCKSEELDMNQC